MRVCIVSTKGDLDALKEKFIAEGDTIVNLGEDCDLTLSDDPKIFGEGVIGFGRELPSEVLQASGFERVVPKGTRDHALVKWFSHLNGWLDQTMLVCPLNTLHNWDLGVECPSGCTIKFVHSPCIDAMFSNVMITQVLQEMGHTGFVTLWRTRHGHIVSLETGIPHYAIYGVCEGLRTKLSKWMLAPETLLESWLSCILVSRHPYPFKEKDGRVDLSIDDLVEDVLRHTHLFDPVRLPGKPLSTDRTRVAVVTAWDASLRRSVERALNTCWNLGCPNKVFRTDLVEKSLDVVTRLESEGVL